MARPEGSRRTGAGGGRSPAGTKRTDGSSMSRSVASPRSGVGAAERDPPDGDMPVALPAHNPAD
mgnify:CR=1 FL=1